MLLRRLFKNRRTLVAIGSAFSLNILILRKFQLNESKCEYTTTIDPSFSSPVIQEVSVAIAETNSLTIFLNDSYDLLNSLFGSSFEFLQNIFIILNRSLRLTYIFTPNILLSPIFYISLLLNNHEENNQSPNPYIIKFQYFWWELLKETIRKSGPCLTKFAQWISTRPDLFPLELCSQFQDLQANQHFIPYNYDQIINILKKEYKANNPLLDWEKSLTIHTINTNTNIIGDK